MNVPCARGLSTFDHYEPLVVSPYRLEIYKGSQAHLDFGISSLVLAPILTS